MDQGVAGVSRRILRPDCAAADVPASVPSRGDSTRASAMARPHRGDRPTGRFPTRPRAQLPGRGCAQRCHRDSEPAADSAGTWRPTRERRFRSAAGSRQLARSWRPCDRGSAQLPGPDHRRCRRRVRVAEEERLLRHEEVLGGCVELRSDDKRCRVPGAQTGTRHAGGGIRLFMSPEENEAHAIAGAFALAKSCKRLWRFHGICSTKVSGAPA